MSSRRNNDDYYGDSVNIAARIQTAADAGGNLCGTQRLRPSQESVELQLRVAGRREIQEYRRPHRSSTKSSPGRYACRLISRKRFMPAAALVLLVAGGSVRLVETGGIATIRRRYNSDHGWRPFRAALTASARPPEPTEDPAAQRQGNIFKRNCMHDRFCWRTIERLAIDAGVTEGKLTKYSRPIPRRSYRSPATASCGGVGWH